MTKINNDKQPLVIKRFPTIEGMGTFSIIYYKDEFICFGLEQEWRDNKPFISCIPSGEYELLPWSSEKYGSCFVFKNLKLKVSDYPLKDKPDFRYACLIHGANYSRQLQGCLAPGSSITFNNETNEFMITASTVSRDKLFKLIQTNDINKVVIQWEKSPISDLVTTQLEEKEQPFYLGISKLPEGK